MRWDEFTAACPRIAELADARLRTDEVVLVGTLRADGSPRISPNEVDFVEGRLLLSMMWQSRKAIDLLRDPRLVVHSVPSDRMNPGGDIKLYGSALNEQDPALRSGFRDEMRRRIDWAPDEPDYHLFSLDVTAAGYIRFGADRLALVWDPAAGCREIRHPDADER